MGKILNTDVQMRRRYLHVARKNGQMFESAFVSASSFENVVILVCERFCVPTLEIAFGSGDINLKTGVVAFSAFDLDGKEVSSSVDRSQLQRPEVGKDSPLPEVRKLRWDPRSYGLGPA